LETRKFKVRACLIQKLLGSPAAGIDLERNRTEIKAWLILVKLPFTEPITKQLSTDLSSASAAIRTAFFILKKKRDYCSAKWK